MNLFSNEEGLIYRKMFNDHHSFMTTTFPSKEQELNTKISDLEKRISILEKLIYILGPVIISIGIFLFYLLYKKVFPILSL